VSRADFLLEIGSEEIPARMIRRAANDLARRIEDILDRANLAHGEATAWGGVRRLAVRVDAVQGKQDDRQVELTGPPASVAFDADGNPTPAALGFAKKQAVDASALIKLETSRGSYVAVRKDVRGMTLAEVLADALPAAVEGMSFPKTMRWADGAMRWVRPVHWVLALHGKDVLPLTLFGCASANRSMGHRFLSDGAVEVRDVDAYHADLERAHVVVDPVKRRVLIADELRRRATELDGTPVDDPGLLDEVRDLVEWPGVVLGRFDPGFLDLPRELLVTTLRHHQKCFSIQSPEGSLLPGFLAIANTDQDPMGHVRRGNEWVVVGRLEDARFFWNEDLKQRLEDRSERLDSLMLHAKLGSYAAKAERMSRLARRLAEALDLGATVADDCSLAASLAKNDLVSGTVGEFPELQGRVGGLLLRAEGARDAVANAVYEHYQPAGPDDAIPGTTEGRLVAVADKLDSVAAFVGIGQAPTGSRDPFGLRRAVNGIFRVVIEGGLGLGLANLANLAELADGEEALLRFLHDRFGAFLRDSGYTPNEVLSVFRPRVDETGIRGWILGDVVARLTAIRGVRDRADFRNLVKLTERVDTILIRNADAVKALAGREAPVHVESVAAALALQSMIERDGPALKRAADAKDYAGVVELLAGFIEPVEKFFDEVLVIDEAQPGATVYRFGLLRGLGELLTSYFDIRELAGQADPPPHELRRAGRRV
jgi:glycyl-tRNA synthetase beta chain